ncbi:hypothetical protein AK812_SmicGene35311 [Symbiodinium microadriaticum]|uniref:Uncharacterized protein n=1 Tax=Symbiodinium microadriaticum TaxID=2951 RepID=A0A1Q9CLS3_SYMMI|nr:hypothetical protein AK812_SmicGene35311 [Symbiodinium microadriaticum]
MASSVPRPGTKPNCETPDIVNFQGWLQPLPQKAGQNFAFSGAITPMGQAQRGGDSQFAYGSMKLEVLALPKEIVLHQPSGTPDYPLLELTMQIRER